MTLQLPQHSSVPTNLSACFYCTKQSLTASLPPEGHTESAFRCTALLCMSNYLILGMVSLSLLIACGSIESSIFIKKLF